MKNIIQICILMAFAGSALAAPEFKLSGRKDRVFPIKTREAVLEAASEYLNVDDDDFIASLEGVYTPFSFVVEEVKETEVIQAPVVKANYDDASVLKVIAANFLKEVSGTMARGTTINLQLVGGRLVKRGTSFPVRIPEIEGRTFTVTITEITAEGIRMSLGDVESFFSYQGEGNDNSIIKSSK